MIVNLARRLGFTPSVPASLVDSWIAPSFSGDVVELAPRDGRASCSVDSVGRIQPTGASWTLDWTLAAGARWVPVSESGRVTQRLLGPGVLETSVETPSGTVVQRVGAAVVGGEPVAIVEIENNGGVAIAVGLVVRPLTPGGRGYIARVGVGPETVTLEDRQAIRYVSPPAVAAACAGAAGDLLQNMPAADGAVPSAQARCRSGGAQGAAIWPLPHTAALRLVIDLDDPTSPDASVPTLADVNRGWEKHLEHGLGVDVGDTETGVGIGVCARTLLTGWPVPEAGPTVLRALAELGFGADAERTFDMLERVDDDLATLSAIARWFQLVDHHQRLAQLESIIGSTALAAHGVAAASGPVPGPGWLRAALQTLAAGLVEIDQPDVAERIAGLEVGRPAHGALADELASLTRDHDERWSWTGDDLVHAARYASAVRSIVVDDRGNDLRLLPEVPLGWRGRSVDVLNVALAGGARLSYGLRWHGPRPALLWEVSAAEDEPYRLCIPGIDPDFTTTEHCGEALLADPQWTRA